MAKSLVIVESPAKAKTINKYLGKDYIVKSSVGHIRDLPGAGSKTSTSTPSERAKEAAKTRKMSAEEKVVYKAKKAKSQLITRMGIDPENDWKANYQIISGKEKVVNELKKLAKNADHVILATDLDREGEAIAWHLREVIGGNDSRFQRVVFNEITKSAIEEAFSHPEILNIDRVNAQQARRFLDRVVGFMLSPLLWAKVARGLSAGRVQSVAVKLVVEREREIRAFNPEEYWEVFADLNSDKNAVKFQVAKENGKTFKPVNKQQTDIAVEKLKKAEFKLTDRADKPTKSYPNPPFITSTLQQAASTRLGFGVKKTMMLAQRLYEAGFITYMRTDSTSLSADAVNSCRNYIQENFGAKYLPEKPNAYTSKKGAQEAHEAIRPSNVDISATQLPSSFDRDSQRLYELIWRQFVSCQMPPAEFKSTSLTITAGNFELRTRGRILTFDGFLKIIPQASKKDENIELPDIKKGSVLTLKELEPKQHFTKPPARYSEASLVKELEKKGIGRPSTYANIISTIQDRGYVKIENKRFYAVKMGDIVTDRLSENFEHLMDYGFTANLEESLDKIADGDLNYKSVLNEFYEDFSSRLDAASSENGMRANEPTETDIQCPECSEGHMQIRTASTGVFLGCSRYSLPPKERCKATMNLTSADEVINTDDDEAETNALRAKHRCPICDTAMEAYLIDATRKLHVCGNNPDCPGYEIETGNFKIKGYDGPVIDCDKCGAEMQLKSGRFGKYFGCTNSECKNTRKLLKNGEAAPPKMDPIPLPDLRCDKNDDHFILRDGAAGLFLAASKFPKIRETRAPLVKEIIPLREVIDPKYTYLTEAPAQDPDKNPAIIRYSRKTKESYVMSEVEGKATGWKAFYNNGTWTEELPKKKSAKAKTQK
ncbi:MAG: type I DNA topoisomerase [Gammaproteobacteria bacterium]|nr:MAG: type I DNA topoisomerase [Gammaproteobacteria bacterium]